MDHVVERDKEIFSVNELRAHVTHEFLMRLSVTDMRWMLAISAIEALVNTKTSRNKNG
jgi:hypothetical protein